MGTEREGTEAHAGKEGCSKEGYLEEVARAKSRS